MTYKTYAVVLEIPENLITKQLDGDDSIENVCYMINNILANASKEGFVAPTVRPLSEVISAWLMLRLYER